MVNFKKGDLVLNFGAVVKVLEVDAVRGLLVKIVPLGGRQGGAGQKYYAQPNKCSLVL